jgi:hypothetical protein
MNDYCLKFNSEDTFIGILQSISNLDTVGSVSFNHKYAFDVIGNIDGVVGWHVNLRIIDGSELPEVFQQYTITPATPCRVWL